MHRSVNVFSTARFLRMSRANSFILPFLSTFLNVPKKKAFCHMALNAVVHLQKQNAVYQYRNVCPFRFVIFFNFLNFIFTIPLS